MGIGLAAQDVPGDGAIHGAGVDVGKSKLGRERAGDAAFAGGGGAVDGDHRHAEASERLRCTLAPTVPRVTAGVWRIGLPERTRRRVSAKLG